MKVAITASGDTPDSPVDGRFSAARYVLIVDMANGQWEAAKFSLWARQHRNRCQIKAAFLAEKGVEALITGGVDPVSFRELTKRGIRIYQASGYLAVEAADMFAAGRFPVLEVPDAIDVTKVRKNLTLKV
jgi:predicted Fe-Mo cluster-binding NifX family protein